MFPVRTVCLFCFLSSNPRKRSRRTLRQGSISLLCSVPDAPGSFTVSQVYCDAFKVSWGRPRRVNGRLIAHIVRHWRNDTSPSNGQTKRLPNTTLSAIVTGLRANTVYSVEIYAETRAGIGTSKTLSTRTTQSPGEITDMFFVFCDVSEQTCRTFWAKLNEFSLDIVLVCFVQRNPDFTGVRSIGFFSINCTITGLKNIVRDTGVFVIPAIRTEQNRHFYLFQSG